MKPLRLPAVCVRQLMASPRDSTCLGGSCSHVRSQCLPSRSSGLELCSAGAPGRLPHVDTSGSSQVSWWPIPYLCPAPRPRPNRKSLTIAASPMLPPHPTRRRLRRSHDFEANHRASVPAVYASRMTLPSSMQDSLPAGGFRLCWEGVEPSGSRRKVSGHILPPFQDFVLTQIGGMRR